MEPVEKPASAAKKPHYRVVALSVRTGKPTMRNRCAYEGCTRYRRKKSLCTRHHYEVCPRESICKAQRCLDVACEDGFCIRHLTDRIKCEVPSCGKFLLTHAVSRCQTHQYACKAPECLKKGRHKGYCLRHYDAVVFGRRSVI